MNQSTDGSNPGIVSIDYFLYTCFEHENTIRLRPSQIDMRWPTGLACTGQEVPEDVETHDLQELLRQASEWYLKKNPDLNSSKPINLENLADIVPIFLMLTKDIDNLVKAKTGDYLPAYEPEAVDSVWRDVDQCFRSNFPNMEKMYLRFLHWSHASQPQEIDKDAGNRPPVGKYAPRRQNNKSYGDRNNGDRNGNRKPDQRPRSNNQNHRNGPSNQEQGQGQSQNRPPSKGPRHLQRGKPRDHRDRKHDVRLERESLKEVLLAVQRLNTEGDLDQYRLPPANSYYRRLQHKQIASEGLYSFSDGEGSDRAVVVVREVPEGKKSAE